MRRNVTRPSAGLLLILLAGCAAQPGPRDLAAAEYRRENARIEAIEQFEERRRSCAAGGGAMHIPRMTSGRLPPTPIELRAAVCSSRLGPVQWP